VYHLALQYLLTMHKPEFKKADSSLLSNNKFFGSDEDMGRQYNAE